MCFTKSARSEIKSKKATKDMYVIKMSNLNYYKGGKVNSELFVSHVQKHLYTKGKLSLKTDMSVDYHCANKYIRVNRGYHAYINKKAVQIISRVFENPGQRYIGVFMIPKGAEYFENVGNGLIVADQMHFVARLTKWTMGLLLKDLIIKQSKFKYIEKVIPYKNQSEIIKKRVWAQRGEYRPNKNILPENRELNLSTISKTTH